jgi:ArsR family transcriptional regulator
MKKVIFICAENTIYSLMAEALLKHRAGDRYEVHSAGIRTNQIETQTIETINKYGLDVEELNPKNITLFNGQYFDYVITLDTKIKNQYCEYFKAGKSLAWDIADLKERNELDPFTATLNELNTRLSMFIQVEEAANNDTTRQRYEFNPVIFYKTLSDDIRLKALMLMHFHGELCVCELMEALKEDNQPKVSRNLAVLKKANVIVDRKHAQWVFYRLNPNLPLWAKSVIAQTTENNVALINNELQRLANMKNRPNKSSFCK